MNCSKHPQWQPTGLEWQCPHCPTLATRSKPLTAKQKVRVAAAGNAVRIDDLSGHAWAVIRKRIRERDCYTCQDCQRAVSVGIVDHIVGLAQGGSNADTNLQLLCHPCHVNKTNKDNGFKVRSGSTADGLPTSRHHHWNT